ncbi:hypothetical protein [Laspinema palackyanum]
MAHLFRAIAYGIAALTGQLPPKHHPLTRTNLAVGASHNDFHGN